VSDLPTPRLPYRASAVMHAVLAALILVVAWLTQGNITKAVAVALGYFVVATGWSWFQLRRREQREQQGSTGEGGRGS